MAVAGVLALTAGPFSIGEAMALAYTTVSYDYGVKVVDVYNVTSGVASDELKLNVQALSWGALSETMGNGSYVEKVDVTPSSILGSSPVLLNKDDAFSARISLEAKAEEDYRGTARASFEGYGYFDFFIQAVNDSLVDTYLVTLDFDYALRSASSVQDSTSEGATSFGWMQVMLHPGQFDDLEVRSGTGLIAGVNLDAKDAHARINALIAPGETQEWGFRSYYATGRALSIPEPGSALLSLLGISALVPLRRARRIAAGAISAHPDGISLPGVLRVA